MEHCRHEAFGVINVPLGQEPARDVLSDPGGRHGQVCLPLTPRGQGFAWPWGERPRAGASS